jgi:glycosyltransferase involved in cell wall biosynthesis
VRDEEKVLPRCLKSVRGIASELIVVDTGSKDNTVSVAKDFGAKVFFFKWCDDFSAARNESIKYARGDWILQIDADEKLHPSSARPLKKAIQNPWCLLYVLSYEDRRQKYQSQRLHRAPRLFRNHPCVKYSRPYHEMVSASVDRIIASEPRWRVLELLDVVIRHYGNEPSEDRDKFARALRIMEPYVRDNPDDADMLARLGEVYSHLGRHDDTIACLKRATAIRADFVPWVYSVLGFAYYAKGSYNEAFVAYMTAIERDPADIDARAGLARVRNGLGMEYARKGFWHKAADEFRQAIGLSPLYAEAHSNLALAYYAGGNYEEAIRYCDKAMQLEQTKVPPKLVELLKPYR